MIVLMELGQMMLAFLLSLLVGLGVVQIWQMIVILALARICVTFELPSRQVFFYELVGPEILSNAIALNSGLFNATRVLGPALAGVCLSVLGATGCFALNGVSYLAAIAAVLSIRLDHREPTVHRDAFTLREILGGLHYLHDDRRIFAQFMLVALFGIVGMGYEAMVPAYARRVVGTGVYGYSVLLACGGIGATVGRLCGRVAGKPASQGASDHRRHGALRRLAGGRGSLAVLAPRGLGVAAPAVGCIGLSPGSGFRRGPALCLIPDDHPARGTPTHLRGRDHGDLDDRLLRLGPAWRALDGPRRPVVGCRVRSWACRLFCVLPWLS